MTLGVSSVPPPDIGGYHFGLEALFFDDDCFVDGISDISLAAFEFRFGVLLSVTSLLLQTIKLAGHDGYEQYLQQLVFVIENIKEHSNNYYYYMTPCPWL